MHLIVLNSAGVLIMDDESCGMRLFFDAIEKVLDLDRVDRDLKKYHYADYTNTAIARAIASKYEQDLSDADILRMDQAMAEAVGNLCRADTKPFRLRVGAGEFIDATKRSRRHGLIIATGGWRTSTEAVLEQIGIDCQCLTIVSSLDANARHDIIKMGVAKAATMRGELEFDRVTYIGDRVEDLNAASTLNIEFIGLAGGDDENGLRAAGARVFTNWTEIVNHCGIHCSLD